MYSFVYFYIYLFIQIRWIVLCFWFAVPVLSCPDCLSEKISPSDIKWWLWTTNCFLTWLACKSENNNYVIKCCILWKVVDGTAVYLREVLSYSSHIGLESLLVWNRDRWCVVVFIISFILGSTVAVGVSIGNADGVHWFLFLLSSYKASFQI